MGCATSSAADRDDSTSSASTGDASARMPSTRGGRSRRYEAPETPLPYVEQHHSTVEVMTRTPPSRAVTPPPLPAASLPAASRAPDDTIYLQATPRRDGHSPSDGGSSSRAAAVGMRTRSARQHVTPSATATPASRALPPTPQSEPLPELDADVERLYNELDVGRRVSPAELAIEPTLQQHQRVCLDIAERGRLEFGINGSVDQFTACIQQQSSTPQQRRATNDRVMQWLTYTIQPTTSPERGDPARPFLSSHPHLTPFALTFPVGSFAGPPMMTPEQHSLGFPAGGFSALLERSALTLPGTVADTQSVDSLGDGSTMPIGHARCSHRGQHGTTPFSPSLRPQHPSVNTSSAAKAPQTHEAVGAARPVNASSSRARSEHSPTSVKPATDIDLEPHS